MDTPRTAHQINASSPGTEVAAETAAALAAASIVFRADDPDYAETLLDTAMTVLQSIAQGTTTLESSTCTILF